LLDSPQNVTKIQCADCSEKISLKGLEYFSVQKCGNCGTSFEVPRQIEHYLLESILSDNGVVAQYRALDLLLNRYVILKKLIRKKLSVLRSAFVKFLLKLLKPVSVMVISILDQSG
jgi:DNA-directed RNA polymerase subunit RPC12/RpoP